MGVRPDTSARRSTSPLIVIDLPDAMLKAPDASAAAARRFASATSATLTKSRVCSPSEKIVSVYPLKSWCTKIGMTLP